MVLTVNRTLLRYRLIPFLMLTALMSAACAGRRDAKPEAPWGETVCDSASAADFDLGNIVANGEMIALTLSGPESYYDYRGRKLGTQYLLCQKLADRLGVSLRMEVCRDTAELLSRLASGDADLIAYPLTRRDITAAVDSTGGMILVTDTAGGRPLGWVVGDGKRDLAGEIRSWYCAAVLAGVYDEEKRLFSAQSVRRHVYSPMLNRSAGVISRYDGLFMTYCRPIRWDWRLMAAQCYQESTFDPKARSWAGACGLMQIMPATAEQLGLPAAKIHDPESNIAAAAKYLGQLEGKFGDIKDRSERTSFVLACYNGGYHHIRDAMALAQRDGKNPHRWDDVARYVLLLSEPQYYRDPIVKYGYMRGSETVDYVARIRRRWQSYRGVCGPKGGHGGFMEPRKAVREKKKYKI